MPWNEKAMTHMHFRWSHRRLRPKTVALLLFAASTTGVLAQDITVVQNGASKAVIVRTDDATASADRLNSLLQSEIGTSLPTFASSEPPPAGQVQIVLCTLASRSQVAGLLPPWALTTQLDPEGFLLSTDSAGTGRVIVMGADMAGTRFGLGELWNYRCRIAGRTLTIGSPLQVMDHPAFSKRIFWNWTHLTNWDGDLGRVHQTRYIDPGGTLEPYLVQPDGYERLFEQVVDYLADHKLNALILWGFLNDAHGGVESAKRLSHYARINSVRILPGIGTVGYGGFYFGGDHPYNIYTFLRNHPEVQLMIGSDGKVVPQTPCPTDPVFQQWLLDGARWYFNTFPEIGGVNLEHGDFFECFNPSCVAERSKPENDHSYLWDMMYTERPVVQTGLGINPGLWYIYSPYAGYDAALAANPPKFLQQYPPPAITQWTYTHMVADPYINHAGSWPASLKPPAGTNHSIGLLHQGSIWDVARQWWGTPNGTYSLIPDVIRWTCARAIDDGSEGIEIVGQVSPASPQNELNYLAFEAFTWDPKLTLQGWIDERLAALYGGRELANRFYQLVSSETKAPAQIEAARAEAAQTAATLTDPRHARRWNQLALELARRYVIATTVATERACDNGLDDDGDTLVDCNDPDCTGSPFCLGPWQSIRPTSSQDAPIYGSYIEPATPYGFWGKGYGGGMVVVGIHTLPAGMRPADVGRAVLRLPRTDNAFSADESCLQLTMRVKHIVAGNPNAVVLADKASVPLGDIGVYRAPGPYVLDDNRFIEFDVTTDVQSDLQVGRSTFAWRVEPGSIPDSVTSYRYFPTVDNSYPPTDNRSKLFLFQPLPSETNCADGIDNDGDGLVDCLDPDCSQAPTCMVPADFDQDADVDQEDFGHLQACFSVRYVEPVGPGCLDADLNKDGNVDSGDLALFLRCFTGPNVRYDMDCAR